MNRYDLDGRTAIVTGGASGLGLAIVERLVASGARVSIWDRNAQALEDTVARLGVATRGRVVDVADPQNVEQAFAATRRDLGDIAVLVCNAGINGANATTWEYPVESWQQVIDVNLTGVFLCCRAVVPHMSATGYGRIVNMASIAGKEGNPNAPAYSASKAGVIALTKSLGKELAKTRITVNCVTPAAVRTPLFDQISPQHIEYMLGKIPMGRFGTSEEIAAMVAFLCSEECSFSTGAVFDLSGGRATY